MAQPDETVRFVSWRDGFHKIAFTKLLRTSVSHPGLKEAHDATNHLMGGGVLEVVVRSGEQEALVRRAEALGAVPGPRQQDGDSSCSPG
ncbi:MAG: hypothetical protein H6739_37075 [Alphaproteobacteria bacterium]|nr:hypothetical protein [Alphaproteobacteria bacterium]